MNNEVSRVRTVASALQGRIGQRETRRLGAIDDLAAARFQLTIQGAVDGEPRAADGEVHPLMPSSVLGWEPGPIESGLMADGNAKDTFAGVDVDGLRLMGGGQQLEFRAPVTVGTELWMDVVVAVVELKSGRSGEFLTLTLDRTFRDADGTVYTTCRETFLGREELR